MITPDKINNALAKIESLQKESKLRKRAAILAEIKESVSQKPFDIGDALNSLASIYETAGEDKQAFYSEIFSSLEQAIGEHLQLLLDDAAEILQEA